MRDAVICSPLRTPVGRYRGMYNDEPVTTLAATVIKGLLDRTSLDPAQVDDVIFGQCYPNGDAPAIGRVAALDAGLPVAVPGYQVDRRCGSGVTALVSAVMQVQTGVSDVVLAGGAESMSQTPDGHLRTARVTAGGEHYPVPGGMLETAENVRALYDIPREEQDAFALESHRRAVKAQQDGKFDEEIVPVGDIDTDEHPRPDTSLEKLAAMKPIMDVDGATVTAGNASGQNDGASVAVVTTAEKAAELGLEPLARLVSWAAAGVDPKLMGMGPVPATARALDRAGLSLSDIQVIELNEAFAAQVLGVLREWQIEVTDNRLNPNGSGISLGHPVGATGGRILATLLYEMRRRDARYGLETMCIGGGQGMAAVFETVA
jgi:acetyl-CoA C-acetyltransferase